MISVGQLCNFSDEFKIGSFCALISRLFLAPHESVYCSKALKSIFDDSTGEIREKYIKLTDQVIKHNKLPERNGILGEKSISLTETIGYKELIKSVQDRKLEDEIFNLLGIGVSGSVQGVSDISTEVMLKLIPDLLVMVNHKHESIRSVGKNIFTVFNGNHRVNSVLKPCIE